MEQSALEPDLCKQAGELVLGRALRISSRPFSFLQEDSPGKSTQIGLFCITLAFRAETHVLIGDCSV